MDFKITSTKARSLRSGMALAEVLIAAGIMSLMVLSICSFTMYSGHSFASLFNYVDLDDVNRIAIDQLTRDVRQANRVTAYSTNSLSLEDSDLSTINYDYDVTGRTLTRSKNGAGKVMLRECDRLSFSLGQRNTVGGSYDVYPSATVTNCKVVNVSWVCSRTILGRKQNTESVQTARIVIRKQGT